MSQSIRPIKPDLVGGTRDLLPQDAFAQRFVISTVEGVYESFGFVPLETPCLEKRGVLTGGDPNFNKSIFVVRVVRGTENRNTPYEVLGEEDTALRFDLTVPLARAVAAYPDLPRPFKRYQLGRVFRGEQPQAGRFREFFQLDFDIIGSNSVSADIEVMQVMYAAMRALGIPRFVIKFNSRKILNGLAEAAGCSQKAREVFRVIDKVDKLGLEGVLQELQRKPDDELDESAVAMTPAGADSVVKFLGIGSGSFDEVISGIRDIFGSNSATMVAGAKELEEICRGLSLLGIPEDYWKVDLSVARGLDYYTGPVFEAYLSDLPELGSVFSGGRFDGLTNRFMLGSNIPGVGASVGIDRLIVGMKQLGLLQLRPSNTSVLVTVFSQELSNKSLLFSSKLRKSGIRTEFFLGDDTTLRAQLAYAAKSDIPYVVIIGPEEAKSGNVQLKNMAERTQRLLTEEECLVALSKR